MSILEKIYSKTLKSIDDLDDLTQGLANTMQVLDPIDKLHIWLEGDLGAGKTTFTRSLLRGLGFMGIVKSPTYNLCEPYTVAIKDNTISVHHFDLYRMVSPLEWEDAGFKDILTSPGICIIEWPEKAEGTLPTPDLTIRVTYIDENTRRISLHAFSALAKQLLPS